ncbi:hypothetical protein GC163_09180 [bacterium]|nr:hypothetical protein [bacterium]
MTPAQSVWWRQAQSDFEIFERLRSQGAAECHLLHYLQMSTEKLSKAYLWRLGAAPPRTHVGFTRFLRALVDRRASEASRIAQILGFGRTVEFENWVQQVLPLAYEIQKLAPAEAGDGPNPEYPWPHLAPVMCPIDYKFPTWNYLMNTGRGRRLLQLLKIAVHNFDQLA